MCSQRMKRKILLLLKLKKRNLHQNKTISPSRTDKIGRKWGILMKKNNTTRRNHVVEGEEEEVIKEEGKEGIIKEMEEVEVEEGAGAEAATEKTMKMGLHLSKEEEEVKEE